MDRFGDHSLSCNRHCKGPLHDDDKIRDGLLPLLQDLLKQVHLIDAAAAVDKEPAHIVPELPASRPFDLSVTLAHHLGVRTWRTPIFRIGFDVTVVGARPLAQTRNLPLLTGSQAARNKELKLRLRAGERKKFQRQGLFPKQESHSMATTSSAASCRGIWPSSRFR